MNKKERFNMRLTPELALRLRQIASSERTTQTAVIERLIEKEWQRRSEAA